MKPAYASFRANVDPEMELEFLLCSTSLVCPHLCTCCLIQTNCSAPPSCPFSFTCLIPSDFHQDTHPCCLQVPTSQINLTFNPKCPLHSTAFSCSLEATAHLYPPTEAPNPCPFVDVHLVLLCIGQAQERLRI